MSRLLREFGKDKENRKKMAAAAKRALKNGDDSVYHNAYQSLAKAGVDKEEMQDFNDDFESDNLNDQPANNLANNESRNIKSQIKLTEEQLHQVIKESVYEILRESGDTHRFGMGKFGLAKDAANKARSLGRRDQADNLESYGADAFNSEYGTDDFVMDEYGQLRHRGKDGKERMYRPQSALRSLEKQRGLQGGQDRYDNALRNNSFIKNSAQIAKAFPRKKMTGGLNAIDTVDKGIHGDT